MPTLAHCTRAFGLALAALGLGTASYASRAPQDEPLPEAATLLDAADAKIATPEARAKLTRIRASGTLEMMGMKSKVEERYLGSDRAVVTYTFAGMSPMTMGVEPRFAWSTDPAMGILTVAGVDAGPMRRLMGFFRRAAWRELYASAKTVQAEEVEGAPCWKIELVPAEGPSEHLFVRRDDGLPQCLDLALPDFKEGTLAMRFVFADWKAVDGVLFPHTRRQVIGKYDLATKFAKLELGAELQAADVAPPEAVLKHWQEKGSRPRTAATPPGVCRTQELKEQHALAVRLEIDEKDVAKTLAVVLQEVMAQLGRTGTIPAGQPYSRYHRREGGRIDLEGGLPVEKKLEGAGRVQPVVLPGGLCAVTWHHGDYHDLPKTYAVLEAWMREQKLRSRGAYYEIYWTDPGLEPDPKNWRTQVIWPVEQPSK